MAYTPHLVEPDTEGASFRYRHDLGDARVCRVLGVKTTIKRSLRTPHRAVAEERCRLITNDLGYIFSRALTEELPDGALKAAVKALFYKICREPPELVAGPGAFTNEREWQAMFESFPTSINELSGDWYAAMVETHMASPPQSYQRARWTMLEPPREWGHDFASNPQFAGPADVAESVARWLRTERHPQLDGDLTAKIVEACWARYCAYRDEVVGLELWAQDLAQRKREAC